MPLDRRRIPFSRIVYIGDGETDIPCMKLVKQQGGYAVAVYKPNVRKVKKGGSPKTKALKLIEQERADYAVPADYFTGKPLDKLIKAIIDKVAANSRLEDVF